MSNMSYCRWQNTLQDLRECAADLEDRMANPEENGELSREEREARQNLFALMCQMVQQIGVDIDEDDVASALWEIDEADADSRAALARAEEEADCGPPPRWLGNEDLPKDPPLVLQIAPDDGVVN